ncbi:MAG: D-tyrosyl-tRNA(Tyr) deacylase, partial [Bacteroidales bacterium]|nr:D-tyrosyl-tRNA(Tyr) deacylase [Bacteroidales bacterium]
DFSDADWLISKIIKLRIFDDEQGIMNLSINQVKGEILLISQFTLHASTKKGARPSYIKAAHPDKAIPLYESFVQELQKQLEAEVKTGIFGAEMQVELINDGPVTIIIDSKNRE